MLYFYFERPLHQFYMVIERIVKVVVVDPTKKKDDNKLVIFVVQQNM